MLINNKIKIGIIGLGLMGGSYAHALRRQNFEVGAIDLNEHSLEYALERGWISHGRTEVDADYIGQFDILIFAVYPKTFVKWLESYQQYIKPGALLTDVTGVKCCVVYEIQNMLRDDLEFIAAHPMAGRESSGIEYSDADIFRSANYIVTPTERNSEKAIEDCIALGRLLGFTTITTLSPEEHDEMIAFLSQLTHCIAVSLMTCRDTACLAEYSGDSFRDLTRIAKINDEMWSELFLLNSEELLKQMDLFADSFANLRNLIANGNKDEMRRIMRLSTSQREAFDMRKESSR